jgi:hypothetical protein
MFFEELSKHLADGQMMNFVVMQKEGVMSILTTSALEKKPLSISGSPSDIDLVIIEEITRYQTKKEVALVVNNPADDELEEEEEKPKTAPKKAKAAKKEVVEELPAKAVKEAVPEVIKVAEVKALAIEHNKEFTEVDLNLILQGREFQIVPVKRNGMQIKMYVCEGHHFVGPIMNKFVCMVNPSGRVMMYEQIEVLEDATSTSDKLEFIKQVAKQSGGQIVVATMPKIEAVAQANNLDIVPQPQPVVEEEVQPWESTEEDW